jgi:hypothetical protein
MDTADIIGGEDWERAIALAIARADFFIACLSRRSVGKRGVLQTEIQSAIEKWREKLPNDIYLIPVRLEACELPERLSRFQAIDLYMSDGIDRIIRALDTGTSRLGQERIPHQVSRHPYSISRHDYEGIEEGDPPFSVESHYPQIAPADAPWIIELNNRIAGWVAASKQDAGRIQLRWKRGEFAYLSRSQLKSNLLIDYTVSLFNEELLSLEFRLWSYYAGAAHPNTKFATFTYWLRPVALLGLDDLFNDGSDYLERLSKLTKEELNRRRGLPEGQEDEWIVRGTSPVKENFSHFSLTHSSLRVVFPEYAVGSYAWGPQEISIPYAQLYELIRTDGPLSMFATELGF